MSVKKSISETAAKRNGTMLPLLRGMFICPEILKSNGDALHGRPLNDLHHSQGTGSTAARFQKILQKSGYRHESLEMISESIAY